MRHSAATWRLIALLALALMGGAAILFLPVREYLVRFLDWVQGVGFWGPVVVVCVYVAACLLFVPGSVLTLGSGFLFGVVQGTVVVSVASTIGASLAFLLGRTLARGWVESKTAVSPRFQALDRAVGDHGFKIVLLTRLSPAFPFNLLNYAYGVTQVSFWKYVLASWIGMLPGTVMYVYFGSAVKSLADLAAGKVEGGVGRNVLFGVGLLATVAVTILITRAARKAMRGAVPGTGAAAPADSAPAASPPASSSAPATPRPS